MEMYTVRLQLEYVRIFIFTEIDRQSGVKEETAREVVLDIRTWIMKIFPWFSMLQFED